MPKNDKVKILINRCKIFEDLWQNLEDQPENRPPALEQVFDRFVRAAGSVLLTDVQNEECGYENAISDIVKTETGMIDLLVCAIQLGNC